MGNIQIIQFTQDQVRAITGISSETLRHWRKNIPYLAQKSGKAARFSFSDVLCLAATAQAVSVFGVSIGNIGSLIDTLFRKLPEVRPASLQNHAIAIRGMEAIIFPLDEITQLNFSEPLLLIPFAPLMGVIQQRLLPGLSNEPLQQLQIPFAPQTVGG